MRHLSSLPGKSGLKKGEHGGLAQRGRNTLTAVHTSSVQRRESTSVVFLALSGDFGAFCLYARLEILKFLSSTYTRYSLCCVEEREIVVSSRDAKITKHAPCVLTMTLKDDVVNRVPFTTETFPT